MGAYRIRLLMQLVDDPQEVFRLPAGKLQSIDGIGPVVAKSIQTFNDWEEVDRLLEKTEKTGAQIITFQDGIYPKLLREIYDPPVLLWIKGDPLVLSTEGIAVVGTRRATSYGLEKAKEFSKELAQQGLGVVSGLAYGVDKAAHQATLKAGGKTVAVLGSGIDNIYPAKHAGLAKEMVESGGGVISEFPPGTNPDAGNFPVRNRVVSGLTLGTLVIESGLKGGSMITARSALDQNREVFAIPHSLNNRNGEGCNAIIKRGWGKLVQGIEDIMVEIPVRQASEVSGEQPKEARWKSTELDELGTSICELLDKEPLHIDDLSERLSEPPHKLLPKLLELEMLECLKQTAGKIFELK